MKERNLRIQDIMRNSNLIHEHATKTPDKVLLHYQDTLVACSIHDIQTFPETFARNALLDQLSHLKHGQVVIGCYATELGERADFLSFVVELKQKNN